MWTLPEWDWLIIVHNSIFIDGIVNTHHIHEDGFLIRFVGVYIFRVQQRLNLPVIVGQLESVAQSGDRMQLLGFLKVEFIGNVFVQEVNECLPIRPTGCKIVDLEIFQNIVVCKCKQPSN